MSAQERLHGVFLNGVFVAPTPVGSTTTCYPWTQVLLCIVHQVRNSLKCTQATASTALIAFTEE